jgi:hypothetical protein
MGKQSARRAGLDAQAGHRRERPERDRRIDALAGEVLDAIGEREAAGTIRRELLQTMVDREQLSLRQAVALASAAPADSSNSRGPTRVDVARVTGRRG